MQIELFVHIAHLDELQRGNPVNCKINYASQYDVKILIDTKKYLILSSTNNGQNLLTVRKRRFKDLFKR